MSGERPNISRNSPDVGQGIARRIALFADLHGNPYACEAVLEAISREGPLDAVVAAGDLCLGGSDPSACIDMLAWAGVSGVYGNTELYVRAPEQEPGDERHRARWDQIQPAARWTQDRLSAGQMDWLQALPFEQHFIPDGSMADELLVVHANPRDVEVMIYPAPGEQVRLWGEVRQPDDDPSLARLLENAPARTIAFGHFHYVSSRRWRDKALVNVGCCSLPGVDHDWDAHYTLLEWDGSEWQVTRRQVVYGAQQEIAALWRSDLPTKDFFIRYFGF